jgi:hypothetical protein
VTAVAVEEVAISAEVAADGAVLQVVKTTARVVVALVTSTHHAQRQPHNREGLTVFYKILRIH